MIKNRINKFATLAVGMTFVFGVVATPAGAQTVAELQAQINALMAQLTALSGTSAPAASATFTSNLTLGSKGAEVTSLQQVLVAGGHLVMPAGVAFGYFGTLTKAAVAKWQAASGVSPALGYWGPISRAKYASVAGPVVVTPGTPGTPGVGITTPGVEGTLTVTSSPVSTGSVYEGDSMVSVLAFKARAQSSDISVQRVKLYLGTLTTIYNKIYSKVYIVDASGKTIGSADLNSNTVVKEGLSYFITVAGLNSVVPKDTTSVFTVKMDVRPSIDSSDIDTETFTVQLADDGVRGVDGAGVNQYSPGIGSDVTRTFSISTSLVDAASLVLSANVNNPLSQDVIADSGTADNELDNLTVLTFDIKAQKDDVLLTDLVATVTRSAGAATASSTYLYAGSTQIGSASSVVGGSTTFSDIDYLIPKETTKTFSIKVDVRSASSVVTTIAASVANAGLTGENSIGDSVTKSGSATSNSFLVRNVGPQFTLSSHSVTRTSVSSNDTTGFATSTGSAIFNLTIKAVGGAISFGSVGSTTPMFSTTTATTLGISRNGLTAVSLSSLTAAGTSAVLSYGANPIGSTADIEGFTIPEGGIVTVPVTASLTINSNSANNYAFQLNGVRWYTVAAGQQTSTAMLDQAAWRTSTVTLP